jgi:hypothetical protein
MFNELVFEDRDLTLVLDVEVSGLDVSGHGLNGVGRSGDTIVCMRHCVKWEVLECVGIPLA